MNGIPVYPRRKNGERPYLAVPEPGFWTPKIRVFRAFFGLGLLESVATRHTHQPLIYFYILLFNIISE